MIEAKWHVSLLLLLLLLGANEASSDIIATKFPFLEKNTHLNSTETKPIPKVKDLEPPLIFLQTGLEVAEADLDKNLETIKEKKKNPIAKISRFGNGVRLFCSIFSITSGFFSLLATVTSSSDLQVISDMFTEVNKKLDKITDRLDKLDNSIELHGLLSNYIPWQYSVTNGIEKLVETYTAMVKEPDFNKRRLIAENFILYFENNQIELNINNLIKLTVTSNIIQQNQLFNELIDEAGCNIIRLTRLHIYIKRIFTQGGLLIVAYNLFKQMEPPNIQKFLNALIYIRKIYESRVWHCKETTIIRSKNDVVKIITKNPHLEITTLLKKIIDNLSRNYPWYSWSIVNVRRMLSEERNSTLGNQYYELEKIGPKGVNLVVTWQSSNEKSSCQAIGKVNTFVFLSICPSCQDSHVFISDNMLSKNKCPKENYPQVKDFIDQRGPELDKNGKKYDAFWVAAGFKSLGNSCNHHCNNHGECRVVPYTDQFQCFCQADYEGEKCDKKIEINQDIIKLVSDLQLGYKNAFNAPSLVNVMIQGENLAKKLKRMMQRIDNQFELTQILVKYIRDLQKLDYILKLGFNYSRKRISVDAFSRRMKKFLSLNPINFIFEQLSNAILAEGFTDTKGRDFFNTFKRMIASNREACSKIYGNEATVLFNRLSRIDITAAEAILAYYNFESNYLNTENMKKMTIAAKQLVRDSKRRMRNYAKYWEGTSCPPLNVTYLTQSGCGAMLSFEGMNVSLSCDGDRAVEPQNIECIKLNNKLQWSATPRCVAGWSNWSQWTPCTSTCGNGTQSRRRICNGESEGEKCKGLTTDVRNCFLSDCCQEMYGKFKCDSTKCLDLSQLCDGFDDCLDGIDESKERCKYLRSGDRIALRNMAFSQEWLSVQYTDTVQADLYYGRAYLDHCIKGDDVTDNEWKNCAGQSMLIYGNYKNGQIGKAIKYGDKIAMYYRKTNYHYRWFICYPDNCMTYICDKSPGTFDFTSKGGCQEYEFYITKYDDRQAIGPVKSGDMVFISDGKGAIKGNGYYKNINQDLCAIKRVQNKNLTCHANTWQIFIK